MDEPSRLAGMNLAEDGTVGPAVPAAAPSAELPVSRGLLAGREE
jgi:hypothetical protein